jgi:hypothetical protein
MLITKESKISNTDASNATTLGLNPVLSLIGFKNVNLSIESRLISLINF